LLAGRSFGEVYRLSARRRDLYDFLVAAVERAGGRLLYVSDAGHAPIYLGIQLSSDERIGVLVYPFRMTRVQTRNRPADEVRGQIRYGSEESWLREHPVGRDVAGVDVSVILGIDLAEGLFLGLDAQLWDPLPMGVSFYAKLAEMSAAQDTGWHVWEKARRISRRLPKDDEKDDARAALETVVAFRPERLIDYIRLERRAVALKLDQPLRFVAARSISEGERSETPRSHVLEEQFALTSQQILDIIGGRNRLAVAVRGGVAEHHLEQQLRRDPAVANVSRLDADAMHDFDVTLHSGQTLRVECKNASPHRYANGDFKVEVQKTRASQNDPASRFYPVDSFDAVAACLFSATGEWLFRFSRTTEMARHEVFPDRLAAVQPVTSAWTATLSGG
jgi:hypothetical protein